MTESFEKTKLAGSIASGALDEINNLIKPGITTAEIDDFCFNYINYSLKRGFMTIGSAHNIKEIRMKEQQAVDQIVLSSLFKKNENYLGLYRFKILKNLTKKKVIVLGGVTKNNQKKIKLVNCNSFAGISYFKKKAPTN